MTLFSIIPFVISYLIGANLLYFIYKRTPPLSLLFNTALGFGLGLGISSTTVFLSFLLLNKLNKNFIIGLNLIFLCFLIYYNFKKLHLTLEINLEKIKTFLNLSNCIKISALIIIAYAYINQASFYSFGGWDAWSVWNIKAKFLFLGDSSWQNMFSPILWRTSPHYPLFLSNIIVWGWLFTSDTSCSVPTITSLLFVIISCLIMYETIKYFSNSNFAFLSLIIYLVNPMLIKFGISQYCDKVFGFYSLTCICLIMFATKLNCKKTFFIAGLLNGFLSFTKPEGFIASILITTLLYGYLFINKKLDSKLILFKQFVIGFGLTLIPKLAFSLCYAPKNITFINGLFSENSPVSSLRFKSIIKNYFFDVTSPKWGGLWILLLIGFLFANLKGFTKERLILPTFIFIYFSIVTAYYFVNTYFEINWWISVTLQRILYSLLPLILTWIFISLWEKLQKNK